MTQKTIFEKKGLQVFANYYPHSPEEPEFLITNGTDSYSTWEQPVLDYDTLRQELLAHREEKEREIAEDVENDDFKSEFHENINLWGMDELDNAI